VERFWRHPIYDRVVRSTKKFHAHDEHEAVGLRLVCDDTTTTFHGCTCAFCVHTRLRVCDCFLSRAFGRLFGVVHVKRLPQLPLVARLVNQRSLVCATTQAGSPSIEQTLLIRRYIQIP
jgi:hypothetical protein